MEKLRRQLEKEEKRIARAEAKATKAKHKKENDDQPSLQHHPDLKEEEVVKDASHNGTSVDEPNQVEPTIPTKPEAASLQKQDNAPDVKIKLEEFPRAITTSNVVEEKVVGTQGTVPDPLTPTSQPSLPDRDSIQNIVPQPSDSSELPTLIDHHTQSPTDKFIPEADDQAENSSLSISTVISDDSDLSISTDTDSDDFTSSSGSSSDDDAPETAPSTRTAPDRVLPPAKNNRKKSICRNFLRGGRCKHGDACIYRHELPQRGNQAAKMRREGKKAETKTERKGLYQRVRQA